MHAVVTFPIYTKKQRFDTLSRKSAPSAIIYTNFVTNIHAATYGSTPR